MKKNTIGITCGILSALFLEFGLLIIIILLLKPSVVWLLVPGIIAPFAGGIIAGLIIRDKPTLCGRIIGIGYFVAHGAYYMREKGITGIFHIKDFSEVFGDGWFVTSFGILLGVPGILILLLIAIGLCVQGCKCGANYKSRHLSKASNRSRDSFSRY